MLLKFMALLVSIVPMVSTQNRGDVLHQGTAGNSQSVIITPRTIAFLSCESGDIVVKVNFTQPFRGLMYAHRSRSSPCRVYGTGGFYYLLRIPLKGCGTWQESPRVFINNVTIRFHPALELEEDETKTVVCRYPPPLTQPPGSVHVIEPPSVGPNPGPTRVSTAKLSEVEILIIICLLLFLSLLTLGIGIAYFCLKRRNIHIVRKHTVSSAPPSQITRLSSSNIPPAPSLLSSVLGHTVRIPRAVPYSAPVGRISVMSSPDHHYEEYPATSSTSGEVSETSVSSSSEDQVESTKQLLFKKAGDKTLLSIPKAILRKSGRKEFNQQPRVHNYLSQSGFATTSTRQQEMEDQTVITVLEPDDSSSTENGTVIPQKPSAMKTKDNQKSGHSKKPPPVYAKVDKSKKTSVTQNQQKYNIEEIEMFKTKKVPKMPPRPSPAPAAFRRQRTIITDIPEESSTSEEIVKSTTVTTSVRREITETRLLSPTSSDGKNLSSKMDESPSSETAEIQSESHETEPSTTLNVNNLSKETPKNILIRDVADIYLTTTVETESHELKTYTSRDVVEKHAKTGSTSTASPKKFDNTQTGPETEIPSPSENWNVIIRQKKLPPMPDPTTEDACNSPEESDGSITDTSKELTRPTFDVRIRTIPPSELKQNEEHKLVAIPPLEMPETVGKIKQALMSDTITEKVPETKTHRTDPATKSPEENKDKESTLHRTVRWMDANLLKDKESIVSSSDSLRSAESLRERSSSEVLEVAPTLPSQQTHSDHPMLERSTSEIVTSPDDHVRWIGGSLPVLETLSPEFLANIPVVIQGGFFNKQTTTPETKK